MESREASAQAQWLDECVIVDGTARAEDYAVAQAAAVAQVQWRWRSGRDGEGDHERRSRRRRRRAVAKARRRTPLLNEQREALATLAAARRAELDEDAGGAAAREAARAQKRCATSHDEG